LLQQVAQFAQFAQFAQLAHCKTCQTQNAIDTNINQIRKISHGPESKPLTTVGSRLEDRGFNKATFMAIYAYEIVLDLPATAPQSGSDKYFVSFRATYWDYG